MGWHNGLSDPQNADGRRSGARPLVHARLWRARDGKTAKTGELVAGAIAEGDDRYKMLAPFSLRGAGGKLGLAGAQALYWWYQMRDKIKDRGPARV